MSKTIGIVTSSFKFNTRPNLYGLHSMYVEYFRQFGNVILIDAGNNGVVPVDLLVLPGGADVNPVRYGEVPSTHTGNPNVQLEYFDTHILPKYIKENIPIFGICRGHQSFAVHMGCKLDQHITQEYSSSPNERGKLVDTIEFTDIEQPVDITTYRRKLYKNSSREGFYYKVNSIHHQAVSDKDFNSNKCYVIARNVIYNNIEAMGYDYPAFTVQWHPEEMNCTYSAKLINKLLYNN